MCLRRTLPTCPGSFAELARSHLWLYRGYPRARCVGGCVHVCSAFTLAIPRILPYAVNIRDQCFYHTAYSTANHRIFIPVINVSIVALSKGHFLVLIEYVKLGHLYRINDIPPVPATAYNRTGHVYLLETSLGY